MADLAARNKIIIIQGHLHRTETSVKQDLSALNVKKVNESARQRALISWLCILYPRHFRWDHAFDSVKIKIFTYLLSITFHIFLCELKKKKNHTQKPNQPTK